jgi:hypothetical protein
MQPDPAPIQKIHNRMFQAATRPIELQRDAAGRGALEPVHQPGASSKAFFLADRFQFREELSSLTHDGFARACATWRSRCASCAASRSSWPTTSRSRTLINPRHFKDSRAYLKQGMFGFDDELKHLRARAAALRIRLDFPQQPGQPGGTRCASSPAATTALALHREPSLLRATAGRERPGDDRRRNLLEAYRFVVDNTVRFIACFDAPAQAEEA